MSALTSREYARLASGGRHGFAQAFFQVGGNLGSAVGPLLEGKFVHLALDAPAEQVFFPAVELAVSIEPVEVRPGAPSSGFVYRGLCGKVWR